MRTTSSASRMTSFPRFARRLLAAGPLAERGQQRLARAFGQRARLDPAYHRDRHPHLLEVARAPEAVGDVCVEARVILRRQRPVDVASHKLDQFLTGHGSSIAARFGSTAPR